MARETFIDTSGFSDEHFDKAGTLHYSEAADECKPCSTSSSLAMTLDNTCAAARTPTGSRDPLLAGLVRLHRVEAVPKR